MTRRALSLPGLALVLLAAGSLAIGLQHLLLPAPVRHVMAAQFAGPDYVARQSMAFDDHPLLINVHAAFGVIFALTAPVQFWSALRNRNRPLHRLLGYTFAATALLVAVTGAAVAYVYPFTGAFGLLPNTLSAAAIIYATVRAVKAARRRDFVDHRAWMVRVTAIGLGIALARMYVLIFVQVAGLSAQSAVALSFWLGSGTLLLLAELYLAAGRPRRRAEAAKNR